jgi:hypothetical protein
MIMSLDLRFAGPQHQPLLPESKFLPGLQALQRCSGLLNRRARSVTVATTTAIYDFGFMIYEAVAGSALTPTFAMPRRS